MAYQPLKKTISHLPTASSINTNVWVADDGQAYGRYFNSSLTSAFQALRSTLDLQVVGYQATARSYAPGQQSESGLSLWRLLDHAASDDESVELDRLCRLLHAINFYRQPQAFGQDLYLHVHSRLLAAVQQNHGAAFRRILDTLELPHQHIALELPHNSSNQRWILNHVSANYQLNGFRIVVNVGDIAQGSELARHPNIAAIRLDGSSALDSDALASLCSVARETGTNIIIKKLDNLQYYQTIEKVAQAEKQEIYVQGFLFDKPNASLFSYPVRLAGLRAGMACQCSSQQ